MHLLSSGLVPAIELVDLVYCVEDVELKGRVTVSVGIKSRIGMAQVLSAI